MQVTVPPLACSDRPPQLRTTLSRIQPLFLHFHHLRTLLHHLFGFSQDKFDVAWVRHVGVDLSPTPNNQSPSKQARGWRKNDLHDHERDTCDDAVWAPG